MPRGELRTQHPAWTESRPPVLRSLRQSALGSTGSAQDLVLLDHELVALEVAGAPREILVGLAALHPRDHFGAEEGHPVPGGGGA